VSKGHALFGGTTLTLWLESVRKDDWNSTVGQILFLIS